MAAPKIGLGEMIKYQGREYPVQEYKIVRGRNKKRTFVGVYIRTAKGRVLVDLPESMQWSTYG